MAKPEGNLSVKELRLLLRRQTALADSFRVANGELRQALDDQKAIVATQNETIAKQNETIAGLEETIRELQRQLGRNSRNSSQPPSKDGFSKPRPQSQRRRSGLKPGGQSGHPGVHMAVPHEPDEVQQHLPPKCLACPRLSECRRRGVFSCGEKRYEVNVLIGTKVTEHQSLSAVSCPLGGEVPAAEFPASIRAHVQYGDSVCVLAGLLSTYGAVSVSRIHTLLGSLMGVGLSTGTISAMVSRCASKVGDTLAAIRAMLTKEGVVHFDETGTDVNGKIAWVHSSSTKDLTYQTVSAKRGQEGMEENGVLPSFKGVGVHDCWMPYWKYELPHHAVCCAHLLRELTGIEEFSPGHEWAPRFKALLMDMKKAKERTMARGEDAIPPDVRQSFDAEYDQILKEAEAACPEPPNPPGKRRGRKKRGKERALIERLKALKASVCLFLHNFSVPFDNNQAERDVRNVKTKTKVSGCFRTEAGAKDYLDIMSFLSTGAKHGVSVFDALTAAFAGNGKIVLL